MSLAWDTLMPAQDRRVSAVSSPWSRRSLMSQMLSGDGLQLRRTWGSLTLSDELWMSEFVRLEELSPAFWLVNSWTLLLLIGWPVYICVVGCKYCIVRKTSNNLEKAGGNQHGIMTITTRQYLQLQSYKGSHLSSFPGTLPAAYI